MVGVLVICRFVVFLVVCGFGGVVFISRVCCGVL